MRKVGVIGRTTSHMTNFNACNKISTAKLLQEGYRYKKKTSKSPFKFYRRHYELFFKFKIGLETYLHKGLSEPEIFTLTWSLNSKVL